MVLTGSVIAFAGLVPVVAIAASAFCGGGPTRHNATMASTATMSAGIPSRTTARLAIGRATARTVPIECPTMAASDTIEAAGHLIDSGHLSAIFDKIIEFKAQYEILKFVIGRTNDDASRIEMRISAPDVHQLDELLQALTTWGCHPVRERDALVKPAEKDRCVPDDFYSTTNHRTHVRVAGRWREVEEQRMDAVIVIDNGRPVCRKLRDTRGGDSI